MEKTNNIQPTLDISCLRQQVDSALRRLFSELNRDPYAPAYGCYDRRFWAWKIVDFPEATFQRNVYPLAWNLKRDTANFLSDKNALHDSITAGLKFAFEIQHSDGSFDQAFPNEHSYGATAFLLQPLLESFKSIELSLDRQTRTICERGLRAAAQFLCRKSETHGIISNHLAGAALSLLLAGSYFQDKNYTDKGSLLIDRILNSQHAEGYFPEYGGADPGYQTLCLYYLAQAYQLHPLPGLKAALDRSVEFLSWFIHPDGSFAGEYGCRRTAVYYPGGIALLAADNPMASAMTKRMITSISHGHTVTLQDIDMGNMAPLLQSTILAIDAISTISLAEPDQLPCDRPIASIDFPEGGLIIRSTKKYYAVVGIANGGIIKVFQKTNGAMLYDDGGYAGRLRDGTFISTQTTDLNREKEVKVDSILLKVPFYKMLRSLPSPAQFLLLRGLNLTFMRFIWLGNILKDLLVNLLILGKSPLPLHLERLIQFHDTSIEITDRLVLNSRLNLIFLGCGIPFTAIHMASARYFQGQKSDTLLHPQPVDVKKLQNDGQITVRTTICTQR